MKSTMLSPFLAFRVKAAWLPIALDAAKRIDAIFDLEREITGLVAAATSRLTGHSGVNTVCAM